MSVNISAKQIAAENNVADLANLADGAGIPRSRIRLEITESLELDYATVPTWVAKCKEYGFKIAIDDFGTGYSSLQHLLELDVDAIKIDQRFVNEMLINPRARRLIRGAVSLAKELKLAIVAEGVETKGQFELLHQLGCDYGQGFYIGRPMSLTEIVETVSTIR
jgi:EAL domain-containing protein (putative c-di-GMP-specific phosphodiesterase class I)